MGGRCKDRELADERILGSGNFVASVLQDQQVSPASKISAEEVLTNVAEGYGVSREQILGASRSRTVSCARRQFLYEAYEKAGVNKTQLGRMIGRSHVAVMKAIEQVKAERGT